MTTHLSRRNILAGALGLGVMITTAACGGDSDSGSDTAGAGYTEPSADLKAKLTYGVWDQTQVDAIQKNIDAFNQKYPGIEVAISVTPFAQYWTKLQTQASSDTLPDLFWMNGPNFQLYAGGQKIDPITGPVKAGAIDPANYPEALTSLYSLEGVQYGVPKDMDTIGVWINTEIFKKAKVDVPTADWTWDDFQTAATAISTALKSDGIYGGAGGMDGQTTYYNTIFEAGGSVVADGKSGYNSPQSQAGLQFWTDLIASGGSPTIAQLTDTTADQWFTSGKLGMYWGGSWFRAALAGTDLEKSIQALPLPKGAQQATVIHGVANMVAANSQNKQAAHALQAYLVSQEAQQALGEAGSVIPAFTGTQAAFTKSMPDANLQVFLDAVQYAKPLPVSANTAAWNAFETKLLPDAFSGSTPVANVSADLASQMDAALAKE
ncbi:sugar ABC transporter substrate-binding protein [Kineosporia sp. NBRC 101731]|uniref:ABC transporter substrate-binding protein n=1 Tax=Kineosporia sp. NBRC 101731 TaxID=3032199 RepID=UPI0024A3D3E4|nr:sugar ABC transporter substrate-binding protein [Kineosporia sp. NBRC 101731]GLY30328.1 sugar ABC transporter substrate-binding protein [Kineosporia sp. NBRC 101731]